jgi:tetratricopeptide (TPR) repeat protein
MLYYMFKARLPSVCLAGYVVLLVGGVIGCAPAGKDRVAAALSVRHTLSPDYRDAVLAMDECRQNPKNLKDYALWGMCGTTVAVYAGDVHDANRIGRETFLTVQKYEDKDSETMAALGNEAVKFFKGEPHERSMLDFQLGLSAYQQGNYEDARVFFLQSLLAAATRDDDAAEFREDFRLGHYWLGRTYLKLGEPDNARVCFEKAGVIRTRPRELKEVETWRRERQRARQEEIKLEAICYKNATTGKEPVEGVVDLSQLLTRADLPAQLADAAPVNPVQQQAEDPEAFLKPDFQQQANLVVVVELGTGPIKYLAGGEHDRDEIAPALFKEQFVDVYIDGHKAGPAFCLSNVYNEAMTRGVKTRRERQASKWLAKQVAKRMPFVGLVAGAWDISADPRHVSVLPGQVHVFAARVTPGLHRVSLRCSDINSSYLPRFDVDRNFIAVPPENEAVVLVSTKENESNAYLLAQAALADAAQK